MVGRLVQQEEVSLDLGQPGQGQAAQLPAGQVFDLLKDFLSGEEESPQKVARLAYFLALPLQEGLQEGLSPVEFLNLGKVAWHNPVAELDRARERRDFSKDRPEQGRLPRAVGTEQRDPFAPAQG